MKRILSLILTAAMMMSAVTFTAGAETVEYNVNIPKNEIIEQESEIITDSELDEEEPAPVPLSDPRPTMKNYKGKGVINPKVQESMGMTQSIEVTIDPDYAEEEFVITEEKVDTARQIYENFIKAPIELFYWTDDGIMRSTGMESEAELEYVRTLAKEVTKDCKTADEKIYAVAKYLAQNIRYKIDEVTDEGFIYPTNPYIVLTGGYTACMGYAYTCEAMLQSIGIPCVQIDCYTQNHMYSAAYNGERWILFDSTWMANIYESFGSLDTSDDYDFTIDEALNTKGHIIDSFPFSFANGKLICYYIYIFTYRLY